MGLRDFLRKLARPEKEEVPEIEKVFISHLGAWAENKIKDFKEKEKKVLASVQSKTDIFAEEIK